MRAVLLRSCIFATATLAPALAALLGLAPALGALLGESKSMVASVPAPLCRDWSSIQAAWKMAPRCSARRSPSACRAFSRAATSAGGSAGSRSSSPTSSSSASSEAATAASACHSAWRAPSNPRTPAMALGDDCACGDEEVGDFAPGNVALGGDSDRAACAAATRASAFSAARRAWTSAVRRA